MGSFIDLTGQKFSRLTVVERDYNSKMAQKYKVAYWLCKCDCGNPNLVSVSSSNLRRNQVKSCGCLIHEKRGPRTVPDMTGQIFGELTVLSRNLDYYELKRDGKSYWNCLCSCGNICVYSNNVLKAGRATSCGCQKSKGEACIKRLLQEANIEFQYQSNPYNWKLSSGWRPYFDFFIRHPITNEWFFVEYDGRQHYEADGNGWNTSEKLIITQQHDLEKNKLCFENHVPLKRIPYWELKNITIKNILDNTFLIKEK